MTPAQKSFEMMRISHGFSPYMEDLEWETLDPDIRWLLVYSFSFENAISDFNDATAWVARRSLISTDKIVHLDSNEIEKLSYLSLALSLKNGDAFLRDKDASILKYYYAARLADRSHRHANGNNAIVAALSDPLLFHIALHKKESEVIEQYIQQQNALNKKLSDGHLAMLLFEPNVHLRKEWLDSSFWARWVQQFISAQDVSLYSNMHKKLDGVIRSLYFDELVKTQSEFSFLSLLFTISATRMMTIPLELDLKHGNVRICCDSLLLESWIDLLESHGSFEKTGFSNPCWIYLRALAEDKRLFDVLESLNSLSHSWSEVVHQLHALQNMPGPLTNDSLSLEL